MITIQEIFEMRKKGQLEQAYAAVLPLYREHHGHYTTLCMFWTASDVVRLRIEAGDFAEAERIFESMRVLYPQLQDSELVAARTLNRLALMLATQEYEARKRAAYRRAETNTTLQPCHFSLLDYMSDFGMDYLTSNDWRNTEYEGHPVPAFGVKVLSCIFHSLMDQSDCALEHYQTALELTQLGLKFASKNIHLLRYQAALTNRCGDRTQAIRLYRQLLSMRQDAYLYSELANLLDDPAEQISLLVHAIRHQRSEAFTQRDRLTLAVLLLDEYPEHAAYELNQVMQLRQKSGYKPNRMILHLQRELASVTPVSNEQQLAFYKQCVAQSHCAA